MEEYIAHKIKSEQGGIRTQTIKEHSEHTKNLSGIYGKTLNVTNICKLIAALHDAGKYRSVFQDYIKSDDENNKQKGKINHASVGAHYVMKFQEDENNMFSRLTKEIVAECIISHHGLKDFITPLGKNEFNRLSIEDHEQYNEAYDHIKELLDYEEFSDLYQKAKSETENMFNIINDKVKTSKECYFDMSAFTRYILSILINADREDTRSFMLNLPLPKPNNVDTNNVWDKAIDHLEALLSTFPTTDKLSQEKTKISEECKAFSMNKSGIYRLSCPTGSGKTLASLRYALYHAKKYKKKHIFYIAPYKSILTQNSAVMKSVFEEGDVLVHHSDIVPEDKEKYVYLNSNWSTPVIMTTAIQFYQTLFSHKTTSIRRFHQLSNAVIIIDEAQTIPLEIISMFNYMMNFLSEICHSTVLLCTATQPLFDKTKRPLRLSEPNDVVEITPTRIEAFKRVHIINKCRLEGYTQEEYAELIMDCWKKHSCVLAIVNTKAEAVGLYQRCIQIAEEQKLKIDMYHLSTSMCPKNCDDKLSEIMEKAKEDTSMICISTTLCEAGVDISLPCVIRSLTGLDSILQAAGRSNRNKKVPYGYVYIVNSKSEYIGKLLSVKEGKRTMTDMLHTMQGELVDDLLLPEKIAEYYEHYYFDTKVNMDYEIKKLGNTQIELWAENKKGRTEAGKKKEYMPILTSALKSAGENFDIMPSTIGVLVPYKDRGKELIAIFGNDSVSNTEKYKLLKEAQLYMIQVYEYVYQKLVDAGMITVLEFGDMLVLKEGYSDDMGLNVDQKLANLFL